MLVKVFIVIKVVVCRSLCLLKLTLSQIFHNSAKITTLRYREWLINVQLRILLLVMPVMERNKLQNFIFLEKLRGKVSSGFVLSIAEIG